MKTKEKNKMILSVSIILSLILLAIIIFAVGYSKFVDTKKGTLRAEIAKISYDMKVISNGGDSTVNPYCILTVRNYNDKGDEDPSNDEIAQTDVNYTIKVTTTNNFDYYAEEYVSGGSGGSAEDPVLNTDITGGFTKGTRLEKQYKVVFINPGDFSEFDVETLTESVSFDLSVVQAK